MTIDFDKFTSLIPVNEALLTPKNKKLLRDACMVIADSHDMIEPQNLNALLEEILQKGLNEIGFKRILFLSMFQLITKNDDYLKMALDLLPEQDFSIEEYINIIFTLGAIKFHSSYETINYYNTLIPRELELKLVKKATTLLRENFQKRNIQIKDKFEPNDRIIIMSYQFLSFLHSPTNVILQYAKSLIEQGKEVMILNSCELSPTQHGPILYPSSPNLINEYKDKYFVEYEGHQIPFYQNPEGAPTMKGLALCAQKIEDFDPAMIIIQGHKSILGELFSERAFVLFSPNGNGIPLTHHNYFVVYARKPNFPLSDIEKEGLSKKYLGNFAFKLPDTYKEPTPPKRSDYNIPEDAKVAVVVGNRLEKDIDNTFKDILEAITAEKNGFILFIGAYDVQKKFKLHPNVLKKHHHIPYSKDLRNIYGLADFFLNPLRTGGGNSAYYAIMEKKPVLGIPYGDCYSMLCLSDYIHTTEDLKKISIRILNDDKIYNEAVEETKEIFEGYIDPKQAFKKLLTYYDQYVQSHQIQ